MIEPNLNPLGRFGHQFHNFLASYLLSKVLSIRLLPSRLIGNSTNWNSYLTLPSTDHAKYPYQFVQIPPLEGSSITASHLKYYYRAYASFSERVLIKLPIDQWAGEHLLNFLPRYKEEIRSMLHVRRPPKNQIAVHIRRGDVKPGNSLFTADARYVQAMQDINQRQPNDWPICIYSEGREESFYSLGSLFSDATGRHVVYCVAESTFSKDPCDDFLEMIASRAFLCSYSTYAYCAIYLSEASTEKYFISDNRSEEANDAYMLDVLRRFGANLIHFKEP